MTRHGKIARLPHLLRQQLNDRLENGEAGKQLADWLNTLPEVNAVLASSFEGRPISEQNLSDWKRNGFVEWQLRRDLLYVSGEYSADAAAIGAHRIGANEFLVYLNAHFAANLHAWDGTEESEAYHKLRLLKPLYNAVLALRRSEQQADRMALDQDRHKFAREKEASRPQPKPRPDSKCTSSPFSAFTSKPGSDSDAEAEKLAKLLSAAERLLGLEEPPPPSRPAPAKCEPTSHENQTLPPRPFEIPIPGHRPNPEPFAEPSVAAALKNCAQQAPDAILPIRPNATPERKPLASRLHASRPKQPILCESTIQPAFHPLPTDLNCAAEEEHQPYAQSA